MKNTAKRLCDPEAKASGVDMTNLSDADLMHLLGLVLDAESTNADDIDTSKLSKEECEWLSIS